jgi:hypothetical protein
LNRRSRRTAKKIDSSARFFALRETCCAVTSHSLGFCDSQCSRCLCGKKCVCDIRKAVYPRDAEDTKISLELAARNERRRNERGGS